VSEDEGAPQVLSAGFADLDAVTLYALLRLRTDVFVVEQACPYPELDGRDTEASTTHLWTVDVAGPTSYLRVLSDPSGARRIGRVCTRGDARGHGLAGALMEAALSLVAVRTAVLDAQSHLQGWYARYGFEPDGPPFVEDGIPHVPMRRPASTVDP